MLLLEVLKSILKSIYYYVWLIHKNNLKYLILND